LSALERACLCAQFYASLFDFRQCTVTNLPVLLDAVILWDAAMVMVARWKKYCFPQRC
jgi:hypothetical protein